MEFWHLLMEIVLLLGAAFVLGAVAQRLKQSAIIGYLLAGTILGPLLFNTRAVMEVAELGVALLLFSIGLEFSFSRLKRLGKIALGGGSLQVLGTMGLFALVSLRFQPFAQALTLGAVVALSSTAVVLRVLVDRAEIDAVQGRTALGILLLQDIAVVPLVLMVTILSRGGEAGQVIRTVALTLAAAGGLVVVFYLIFYWLVPRVLLSGGLYGNRELVILLTIIAAAGSAWCAHAVNLSPALGAFLAGMLLGESPFAAQIRSDVGSLRTLFVTLFFTSIGMLMEPAWLLRYGPAALAAVVLVICGKAAIIYGIARIFGLDRRYALASGITLSQIGEFSFVLATAAHQGGLLAEPVFALVVTANILSLFAAPYLITYALPLSDAILRRSLASSAPPDAQSGTDTGKAATAVTVIGYGPAGQQVCKALRENGLAPDIIELNPKAIALARDYGISLHTGDATSTEVLIHAGIPKARAVIVTVPDPRAARDITAAVRGLAPQAHVLVRSRFQRHSRELERAGASEVVDEENTVGRLLAHEALMTLDLAANHNLACALAGRHPEDPIPSDSRGH